MRLAISRMQFVDCAGGQGGAASPRTIAQRCVCALFSPPKTLTRQQTGGMVIGETWQGGSVGGKSLEDR
jgi:hypothetical protein